MLSSAPLTYMSRIRLRPFILIVIALAGILVILSYRLWQKQLGYLIGETLMSYQFGFYRRAIVGNIFLPITNRVLILIFISLLYSSAVVTPLLLVKRFLADKTEIWATCFIALLLCSPFGTFFYIKNVGTIKKEILFYPIFFIFLYVWPRRLVYQHITTLIFISLLILIHESFYFLFLPFFLAYLWLNKAIRLNWIVAYSVFASVFMVCLSLLVPGNSAIITEKFIQHYVSLGFERKSFIYFEYYQKLTSAENISEAFNHFTGINPFIFFGLYFIQFFLLYMLTKYIDVEIKFKQGKSLVLSLLFIFFMAFFLCFIGMDYGRWLAMAFTTSFILITTQIQTLTIQSDKRPFIHHVLLALILVIGWGLILRIPGYTFVPFSLGDWISVTNIIE